MHFVHCKIEFKMDFFLLSCKRWNGQSILYNYEFLHVKISRRVGKMLQVHSSGVLNAKSPLEQRFCFASLPQIIWEQEQKLSWNSLSDFWGETHWGNESFFAQKTWVFITENTQHIRLHIDVKHQNNLAFYWFPLTITYVNYL